jgi:hypothetical protein
MYEKAGGEPAEIAIGFAKKLIAFYAVFLTSHAPRERYSRIGPKSACNAR